MTRGMGEEIFEHKFGISENGGHCWRRVGKRQRKVRQLFKDHVQIKKRKKKNSQIGDSCFDLSVDLVAIYFCLPFFNE